MFTSFQIPQISLVTLHNVCAVHQGMFSTQGDITEYTGRGVFSTLGDITSTPGDTMNGVWDIMSTAGVSSTLGDTMSTLGGGGVPWRVWEISWVHTGGCSVHWGFHTNSVVFLMTSPTFVMIFPWCSHDIPQCIEHPQSTHDIPHRTHDIPQCTVQPSNILHRHYAGCWCKPWNELSLKENG